MAPSENEKGAGTATMPYYLSHLMRNLQGSDNDARWSAANTLKKMGPAIASYAPFLLETLEDENRFVCAAAVYVLGGMGSTASFAAPRIANLLQDPTNSVRANAAYALYNIALNIKKRKRFMEEPELTQALNLWQNAQASLKAAAVEGAINRIMLWEARRTVRRLVAALQREQQRR